MVSRSVRRHQKKIEGGISVIDRIVIAGAAANGRVVRCDEVSKSQIAGG